MSGFGSPGYGDPPGGGPPPGGGGFGGGPPAGGPPGGGFGGAPPGGGGGFGGGPPGGGGQPLGHIPFGPDDDKNIRQTALFMRISGGLALFGVVFGIIGSIGVNIYTNLPPWGPLCTGVFSILVQGGLAAMLFMSANSFVKIVDTDGQDQHHLADGLKKLRVYFLTKAILWVLGFLLCCGGIVLAIIMGAAFTALLTGAGGGG